VRHVPRPVRRRGIEERARGGEQTPSWSRVWVVESDEERLAVIRPWGRVNGLRTSLVGLHQAENAGLVVAAPGTAFGHGAAIDDAARQADRRGVQPPGRFEPVSATAGLAIILDGVHSPVAAKSLRAAVARHVPAGRITVVVGMLDDTCPEPFMRPLADQAARWISAELTSPRGMLADLLTEALATLGQHVEQAPSIAATIGLACEEGDVVIVTSSLTMVAEARVHLGLGVPDPSPGWRLSCLAPVCEERLACIRCQTMHRVTASGLQ